MINTFALAMIILIMWRQIRQCICDENICKFFLHSKGFLSHSKSLSNQLFADVGEGQTCDISLKINLKKFH